MDLHDWFPAPALSAVITASGQSIEGQSYSLACEVVGDESLAVNSSTLRWDRVGGSRGISQEPTLTFNPLSPDDTGEYRCISTITSPYLTGTRTVMTTITISKHMHMDNNRVSIASPLFRVGKFSTSYLHTSC